MVDEISINIRDFHPSDMDLIVSLNHKSVAVLSAMDDQRFKLLREQSAMCCGLQSLTSSLLGF
jgi:predicted GNAT superfamily acetyltransferase